MTGEQKYGAGLVVYHSAPEHQDWTDQTPKSNIIHLFIWVSCKTSCYLKITREAKKVLAKYAMLTLEQKGEKKSLKKLKMNRARPPALSPQFRATLGFQELPPEYRATMHSEEFIVLGDKVSRKLPCPSRVYFGTFNSHSAWVERWLQKEADPNSKLSSAHKKTIEAAFLLLTLLRELSKGAFFSIFYSLMSKGLAEKERKNKEQMVKEPCIWSSRKKIQRKICFYNITLGWVKTTYHSSNSPDCCRQRI